MAVLKTYNGFPLWRYLPSRVASIIFTVLFIFVTLAVFWRMFKTRTWFCVVFAIGGVFEVVGYVTRIIAYERTDELPPFAIQNSFILLAPALFAASLYMTLGRLIRRVNAAKCSVVPLKWLTKIFVAGDVFSFLIQGGGAGLLFNDNSAKAGENIILGGLCIQVLMFGLFIATSIIFQVRVSKNPTLESQDPAIPWKKVLYMLYATSAFVLIRSIFRVVEYVQGQDGYLLSHEWSLYVFDSTLMFLVVTLFSIWYPSIVHPPREHEKSSRLESVST